MTQINQVDVPCFYHVWNHSGVKGGYRATGSSFQVTSDFLERDAANYVPHGLDRFFHECWSKAYRNGALQPYDLLAQSLYDFTKASWAQGVICQPTSVEDWAWHYRFQLETVKLMYRYLTKTRHPPVGHRVRVLTIDPQGNVKELPAQRRKASQ